MKFPAFDRKQQGDDLMPFVVRTTSARIGRSTLLLGTAALSLAASAAVAQAQEAPEQGSTSSVDDSSTIVVTGSRVIRDGSEAPTPLTVSTIEELVDSRPLVSEALNQLPAVEVGSQRTGGAGSRGAGFATVSLRRLGSDRTLVLLDGRRFVPTRDDGSVDTSLMPNNLMSRVDVVTGGASAAYGADAVAGVVNYILDTDFTGFKAGIEAGLSQRNDLPLIQGNVAIGTPFAGGRGHFLLSGEYYQSSGFRQQDRDFLLLGSHRVVSNPCAKASAPSTANCPEIGGPARFAQPGFYSSNGSVGGLIISGPLRGITFDEGGVPRPYDYGTYVGSSQMFGGEGDRSLGGNAGPRTTAVGWLERANTFARLDYDVTDSINVYAENLIGWSLNENTSGYPYGKGGTALRIQRDNAFLPEAIGEAMDANGISEIRVAKEFEQWPSYITNTDSLTWRAVVGASFEIGDRWRADAYFQHGKTHRDLTLPGMFDQIAAYNAIDSVVVPETGAPAQLVPGTVVCRSTLTDPDDGCIPANIFGPNSASEAAIFATSGLRTPQTVSDFTQDVVAATISGELFELPAGPLLVAAGAEARWEDLTFESDPYSQIDNPITRSFGGYRTGNALPYAGQVDVKEVFAEAVIPVFEDASFARSLELNVAARVTDYSTSGTVTTWKGGVLYRPIDDLLIRATRSRDIRAPNMFELFSNGRSGTANIYDPFRDVDTSSIKTVVQGNPNLRPEVADTLAVGFVYQPSWFDGFTISVDYYDIKIKDAIASIGNQTIMEQCFENQASDVCDFIVRDANGVLTAINNRPFNFVLEGTDGIDFEMSLRRPIGEGFPLIGGGDFNFRLLATNVLHNFTQTPGEVENENAGEPDIPHWKGLASVTVAKDGWRGFLSAQFRNSTVRDNTWVEGVDIDNNSIPGFVYLDARISKEFDLGGGLVTWSFSINNLLDKQPPPLTAYTFRDFDMVGRYFRTGVNVSF